MPRRAEIKNTVDSSLYSLQRFDEGSKYEDFTPETEFEKWAAVEVTDIQAIPGGMESLQLKGGKYAVFLHQGPASAYRKTWQFIFEEWLPASEYELDDREHFEILKPGYRPDDPNAEEDVWIPIK